jgi:hypothetical protein
MSADIVHIRDFRRREEREAARKAKRTAAMDELIAMSADWIDTAPSEMPPVQPYFAPEKDPA